MRKIIRSGRGLGLGMAAAFVACLAGGGRAQNPAPAPVIAPRVDATMQEQAIANGLGLLAKPKWKAQIPMNMTDMKVVGPMLVCSVASAEMAVIGDLRTMVFDRKTGQSQGETKRIQAPMAWSDDGLLSLGNSGEGSLNVLRWSLSAKTGVTQWETTYKAYGNGPGLLANAIFADEQVIAGEQVPMLQQGPNDPASLTIRSFDRKTGRLQWATPVPGKMWSTQVRAAEGTVYVLVAERKTFPAGPGARWEPSRGFVMGLNAADGKVLWKTDMGVVSSDAAILGSVLVTLGENSEVTAYDGRTGKQRWHTLLSPDCDPSKSNTGVVSKSRVYVDQGTVFAALTPINTLDLTGIAMLDLESGRQTGYFDAKGFPVVGSSLQFHRETIIGQVRPDRQAYCVGINRKTLRLEWQFPAWSSTVADGVLYCANTPLVNGSATPPAEILALDLDAPWSPIPTGLP